MTALNPYLENVLGVVINTSQRKQYLIKLGKKKKKKVTLTCVYISSVDFSGPPFIFNLVGPVNIF